METSTEKLLIDTLTTLESIRVLILSIETTPSNEEYFNNVLDIVSRARSTCTRVQFMFANTRAYDKKIVRSIKKSYDMLKRILAHIETYYNI